MRIFSFDRRKKLSHFMCKNIIKPVIWPYFNIILADKTRTIQKKVIRR